MLLMFEKRISCGKYNSIINRFITQITMNKIKTQKVEKNVIKSKLMFETHRKSEIIYKNLSAIKNTTKI